MAHELCKICREKKATPSHVNAAHGMKFAEYTRVTEDPEYMKEVEKHREMREKRDAREYHLSRLLTYHWYPEARALTRAMGRFTDHARTAAEALNPELDISGFTDKDEAIVGTVILAEALIKEGWECVKAKGGMDKIPKEYYMRRL